MIERHPELGERILAPIDQLAEVRPIVRACHERYDGTGYPGPADGGRDPARGADHLRLRRLPRDDDRPAVPRGAADRGGVPAPRGGRGHAVRPARRRRLPARAHAAAALRGRLDARSADAAHDAQRPRLDGHGRASGERRPVRLELGSAVQSSWPQRRPKRVGGSTNVTGSRHALKRTRNESSSIGSPSAGERRDLGPVEERAEREGVTARPVGLGHLAAVRPEPPDVRRPRALPLLAGEERGAPEDRVLGAEAQHALGELAAAPLRARRAPSRATRARCPGSRRCCCRPACSGARRPRAASASPARAAAWRGRCGICRSRSSLTAGSSVSPSTPQFHERLSSEPSRLSSRFASLCLRSYETRSRSVKPSWHVTKLIDADGCRPSAW